MTNLDRAVAPPFQSIHHVSLPVIDKIFLDNGIALYAVPEENCDVVKLELVFRAGRWYEPKNLVSDITARMLREGTSQKTAREIADFFDFYGSNFHTESGAETATVSLHCLSKFLAEQLPLVFEVITESNFPEYELRTVINNRQQKLAVDLEKNDVLAYRELVQAVWGSEHPYGRVARTQDFEALTSEELKSFARSHYHAANCFILLAGKFRPSLLSYINNIFGQKNWLGTPVIPNGFSVVGTPEKDIHIEKSESVQSAIQAGNISLNKKHPDFIPLMVANTIFGGYFGSRLMSNLREDKGYTYGVYSSIVSYPHGSFLNISAEVGKEFRASVFCEIEKEIYRMHHQPVHEEELQTVKNYLSGKILRSIDGAIRFSETLKNLILHEQEVHHIQHLLHKIRHISSEDIVHISRQYLHFEQMYKVSVG
jgi:predicted Zn-dependent peptidase